MAHIQTKAPPLSARLNLGSGEFAPDGWIHVDYALGATLAKVPVLGWIVHRIGLINLDWPANIVLHDLRKPLPWADESVHAVYSSHTLEHLSQSDGLALLRECHRVMAKDGIIRIVVPDLRAFVHSYLDGRLAAVDFIDALDVGTSESGDGRLKRLLAPYVRFPHQCMYDTDALVAALTEAGFAAEPRAAFDSRIADIASVERGERTRDAVIVEGVK